jgi:hypothetical protein
VKITNILKTQTMKKVLSIAILALAVAFVACGPSQADKDKLEADAQRRNDSLQKAMEATMSSAPTEATVDSAAATTETTAPAAEEKH